MSEFCYRAFIYPSSPKFTRPTAYHHSDFTRLDEIKLPRGILYRVFPLGIYPSQQDQTFREILYHYCETKDLDYGGPPLSDVEIWKARIDDVVDIAPPSGCRPPNVDVRRVHRVEAAFVRS